MGGGAFRLAYDAGKLVIKLRRYEPNKDNPFSMIMINDANKEEATAYEAFKDPIFVHFILRPTYVSLPNKHDAILMEKVDFVWGDLGYDERDEYAKNNPLVHNQIQIIKEVFRDGHDFNIGVKGNRAYLIDFNFPKTWDGEIKSFKSSARKALEQVGVKFRGRKPKVKLLAMEEGA